MTQADRKRTSFDNFFKNFEEDKTRFLKFKTRVKNVFRDKDNVINVIDVRYARVNGVLKRIEKIKKNMSFSLFYLISRIR